MPAPDSPAIAWRDGARARLTERQFDLLVIGGGITGAGIARDAALRGLTVALLERDDFGSGTSGRSSRLVHGGVRYLEHGYFSLVFEASRERRTLLRTAPHLVRPLQFTWPVYRAARIPKWKLRAGLGLYDTLALFRNVGMHHGLSRAGVLESEPELEQHDLVGGATYWDATTDDAALTLANVLDARQCQPGAVVLNHCDVTGLTMTNGRATGVTAHDKVSGANFAVRATVIVNATGPWTDAVRQMEDPSAPRAVLGTKGVHIAVSAKRVGNCAAVTMLSPVDGRVMFCLPAGEQTIVGTTDTRETVHPEQVRASRTDVEYLLAAVNGFFPGARLGVRDVISAWAGIRPLVSSGNSGNPASASREHAISTGPSGVVAISGGKLTTYRLIAEQVVDRVAKLAGKPTSRCVTAERQLPNVSRAPVFGQLFEPILAGQPWTFSDATHAVEHEMACTLADILIRRTKVAFASRDHGLPSAPRVAEAVAHHVGWDRAECTRQVECYRAEVARLFTIDD